MGEWKAVKKAAGAGWKELEREAGTGWKALEWDSGVPVDIGGPASDYEINWAAGSTYITNENPANANGTITEVDIFAENAGNNVYLGIFYVVSGNTLKCRSAANVGSLNVGINNNVAVSLAIETGDYIGSYCANEDCISRHMPASGAYDLWYHASNGCVVDSQITYVYFADRSRISIYGTG